MRRLVQSSTGGRARRSSIHGKLLAAVALLLLLAAATWLVRSVARAGDSAAAGSRQPGLAIAGVDEPPAAAATKTTSPTADLSGAAPVGRLPSSPPVASAGLPVESSPAPAPTEPVPLGELTITLRTEFRAGRMLFVGAGGDVDGVVSPQLIVAPGALVRVILVNDDGMAHDIYFPDFDAQSEAVERKGETTEIIFTIPADQSSGDYVYYCTKPGHRQAGQEGWLTVDTGQ